MGVNVNALVDAVRYIWSGSGSLYDQFHTNVPGVKPLYNGAWAYDQIANEHQNYQDDLRTALNGIRVGYTGTAAESMRNGFQPLIDMLGEGAEKAKAASDAIQQQADHFTVAQAAIQRNVPVPPEPWYENLDPMNTDYDNALQQNSGIDSVNQAAFRTYGGNTRSNVLPTFESSGSDRPLAGNVAVTTGPQLGVGAAATGGTTRGATGTHVHPEAVNSERGDDRSAPSRQEPINDLTRQSDDVPPQTSAPVSVAEATSPSAPVVEPGSILPPDQEPLPGPIDISEPIGRSAPIGGDRTGSPGGRGVAGEREPAVRGGLGAGPKSGIGPAEERLAVETEEPTAARVGVDAVGGPLGGRRGREGEDIEHKSPTYLVNEENGAHIVGEMGQTAPPVIGL